AARLGGQLQRLVLELAASPIPEQELTRLPRLVDTFLRRSGAGNGSRHLKAVGGESGIHDESARLRRCPGALAGCEVKHLHAPQLATPTAQSRGQQKATIAAEPDKGRGTHRHAIIAGVAPLTLPSPPGGEGRVRGERPEADQPAALG